MKGIFISNRNDGKDIFQSNLQNWVIDNLVANSFQNEVELLSEIKHRINNDHIDFLIINIGLAFNKKFHESNYAGVSLLKYFRMSGYEHHCVLFGLDSLQNLICNDIGNSVLTLKGNTYLNLNEKFNDLSVLVKEKAKVNDPSLKKIVRAEMDFERIRHEWTNYWAMYRMGGIHEKVAEAEASINLSPILQMKLRSYLGTALKYLYGDNEVKKINENEKHTLANMRRRLLQANPKVMLIDDMAELGWSEVFKKIIHGEKKHQNFEIVPVIDEEKDLIFFKRLETQILQFQPNIILLDLRLKKNEVGTKYNVKDVSGAKALKHIRKVNPYIPVIITTASNKARTVLNLKELGAYSVWSKESFDEQMNFSDEVNRYKDLLTTLNDCITNVFEKADRFVYGLSFELLKFEKRLVKAKIDSLLMGIPRSQSQNVKELLNYDICVIDTNIFLNQFSTIKYYKSLRLLLEFFKKNRKSVVVLNESYDEVIKYAKFHVSKIEKKNNQLYKTARFALNFIQKMNDKEQIYIEGLNSKFDIHAYADDQLVEFINNNTTGGKRIVFITNDRELKSRTFAKIQQSDEMIKKCNHLIIGGKELLGRLMPLVELIQK